MPPGAAVHRAEETDEAWTVAEHVAAAVFDALNIANWQRSGGKGSGPDPIPRPTDAQRQRAKAAKYASQARIAKARQEARRRALDRG